ncbi:hypothetical protein Q7C36_004909 [Tachysurus vachellii]|uniref:Uncharacterized protein n=1 Tax=Tachysurus vachellii TaxID=175792 RepID=A0AA88NNB8_TACVA|nr:hypothetical protein Q7C36_004909 [Tachysurus vachellii]
MLDANGDNGNDSTAPTTSNPQVKSSYLSLQDGRMGEKPGWRLREEEGENWREKGERGSSALTERPYRDISLQLS